MVRVTRRSRQCSWSNRCKSRADLTIGETERLCRKHATAVADGLVGTFVKKRDGHTCLACGKSAPGAVIHWAHIHTRGKRYIRWLIEPYPGNSLALCQGCHFAYTANPANWQRFIERTWPGHWDRLDRIEAEGERNGSSADVVDVIVEFRGRVA